MEDTNCIKIAYNGSKKKISWKGGLQKKKFEFLLSSLFNIDMSGNSILGFEARKRMTNLS
jgi:hypothetical protein